MITACVGKVTAFGLLGLNEVFPHAACTVTLVDRLIHRSEIIEIEGDSYRLKEAKERKLAKVKSRKEKSAHTHRD